MNKSLSGRIIKINALNSAKKKVVISTRNVFKNIKKAILKMLTSFVLQKLKKKSRLIKIQYQKC